MLGKNRYKGLLVIGGLSLLLIAQATNAYAKAGHYHGHKPHRNYRPNSYPFGRVVVRLPSGFFSIVIGGRDYFYRDGFYYRHEPNGYVIVPAPIGARVVQIPFDRQIVYINGEKYYYSNGVYYVYTTSGYEVVPQPMHQVKVNQTVQVYQGAGVQTVQESFTVNVPNNRGGYTAVIISRQGEGFVGPQGEYYDKFPNIEQLKVMYPGIES